jgi:hypothetical protein
MKFDTFLVTVNDWGTFQKVKYSLICLTYTLPAIMVYTYTFSAATPSFRCGNPSAASMDEFTKRDNEVFKRDYQPTKDQCSSNQKAISLKECQRCFIRMVSNSSASTNSSLKACDSYVYDRQYYQKTLVEEVSYSHLQVRMCFTHDYFCKCSGQWSAIVSHIDRGYKWSSLLDTWSVQLFSVFWPISKQHRGTFWDYCYYWRAFRYGRRPIMGVSFILMTVSVFLCAFGPQLQYGFWYSYVIFVVARFLIACSTRGVSVSGFILGAELGKQILIHRCHQSLVDNLL